MPAVETAFWQLTIPDEWQVDTDDASVVMADPDGLGSSSITTLQDKMYAQYVASNRMAEIRLEQRWPVRDNHSGTMAMGGQTWRWQQQVTETVTPNVVAIRVTVGRSEEEGEATRLMSYYRRPQEAATTELTQ